MKEDKSVQKGMEYINRIIAKNYDKHNYFNHYRLDDVEKALQIAVKSAREELCNNCEAKMTRKEYNDKLNKALKSAREEILKEVDKWLLWAIANHNGYIHYYYQKRFYQIKTRC